MWQLPNWVHCHIWRMSILYKFLIQLIHLPVVWEKILMNRIIKIVFRGVLPLIIAYTLLFASVHQSRTYLLSITWDWIIRVGLTVYLFLFLWAFGDLLTRDISTQFRFLEKIGYPPFRLIYAVLGFLGAVAMIFGSCFLTYWVITSFLPQWIAWREAIVGSVFLFSGWLITRFFIDWIRWYKNTFR